jgi:DNA-binding PadR family transcriptional regulator
MFLQGFNLDKFLQPKFWFCFARKRLGYLIIHLSEGKRCGDAKKSTTPRSTALSRNGKKGYGRLVMGRRGVGAAKKIYRITPVGQRCLLDWRNTLMEYRNSIGSLITDIEAVIGSEAGRDGF